MATPAMPTSPCDPRVVAVVAAVGRQVERDRQALLAGGQVAPVEGVGLLGRREPGVLADRPRLVRVHRRVRAAQERRQPGVRREEVEAVDVGGRVEGADVDALGRLPARRRRHRRRRPPTRRAPTPRRHRGAGSSRSRERSWHLQEAEELGEGGAHVGADVDRALDADGGEVGQRRLRAAGDVDGGGAGAEQRLRRRRRPARRRPGRWSRGRRRWRRTPGTRRRSPPDRRSRVRRRWRGRRPRRSCGRT